MGLLEKTVPQESSPTRQQENKNMKNMNLEKLGRIIEGSSDKMVGHVARMGEERGVYRVLVRKPEGKRPLGRPRRRWMDNIRVDLQKVGCGYMDWIGWPRVETGGGRL